MTAAGGTGWRIARARPSTIPMPSVQRWMVIAERGQHPHWGAPKIRARLLRNHAGHTIPAESTMGEILKRHGLTVNGQRRRPTRAPQQPLAHAGAPNDVWCVDFKGWFRTANA